jgi:phosphopantothenate-cysteine ligase
MASFDLDAREPSHEIDRLVELRATWQHYRDRLTLVRLAVGNVADYAQTLERVLKTHPIDVVILPMAVADYEPEKRSGKISSSADSLALHCRRTPKVISHVRDWAPDAYIVGFKLLSHAPASELIRRAAESCTANRTDLTVANDIATLTAGRHTIHLVRPGRDAETLGPRRDLADALVERVFEWAALARATPAPATDPKAPAP